jgi:hypothetical protein
MTSTRLRAVAALSLLVLAAGCGGGAGDDAKSGADSAFAKKSGNDIAAAAKADMKGLDSVKYSGEITSGGSDLDLDIQASSAGDCTGSVKIGEGTAEVLATGGENWFKPDEAFWRSQSPDQADAIIAAVGDKWIIDSDENFSQFCDLDAFFDNIFTDDDTGKDGDYKVTGTDTLDGQDVVKVEKSGTDGNATGYVLIDGKHYLLKLEKTEGDEPGKLEFSEFDEDVTVQAPAADDIVDPSTL